MFEIHTLYIIYIQLDTNIIQALLPYWLWLIDWTAFRQREIAFDQFRKCFQDFIFIFWNFNLLRHANLMIHPA
jgi:hypothetical protein